MKLEDKDGKENKTHYSYDNLLNLSRTDNADNSYRLTSDTYQTNFETSYGMYYGLINKKEYTDEEGNQSQKYSDAAGNRIRKQMYRSRLGEESWTLYNDEVYIRDAAGRETAVYENSNLQYINIWGAGLEGKVRKDGRGNNLFSYYYKDHLGSITAVMDGASGTITQAQDYDAWGDICRTYSTTDTTVNKFTGKERDQETGYDYFGARYYDSRIGRWLSMDLLMDKYIFISPYSYTLNNPLILTDPTGLWIPEYNSETKTIRVRAEKDDNLQDLYSQLGLTKEEFAQKFNINDINAYQITNGETNFDITNFIIKNDNFSTDLTNTNCFSSVLVASGAMSNEPTPVYSYPGSDFTEFLKSIGFEEKIKLNSGMTVTWIDENGITQHSAQFVIKSKSGVEYYWGRPGQETELLLQTSKKTKALYPNYKIKYLKYKLEKPIDSDIKFNE